MKRRSSPAAAAAPEDQVGSYLNKGKSIESTYKNMELRQHIYTTPDTYAGSIDPKDETVWVWNETAGRMEQQQLVFRDAFYKIFDEVLVNAMDQCIRLRGKKDDPTIKQVTKIEVTINKEDGVISVENTGEGIDVAMHADFGCYVPQVVFGELLTSVNYDASEERTVGGKNGYGAKITNIFSKEFTVETVDSFRKLHYRQTFRNNMSVIEPPEIKSYTRAPFTKITYRPDFERFGIKDHRAIDDWKLLTRRVYDIAGCIENIQVHLNGSRINVHDFEDYMSLYIGKPGNGGIKRVYLSVNERWQVGVCLSPDGDFQQVSFVNGIFTDHGGRHVAHIVDNICKRLVTFFTEKKRGAKDITIKPDFIRKNLFVFIRSTIVNPSFDSQSKRELNTLVNKFGSRADLPDEFIEKIAKIGILEIAQKLAEFKQKTDLSRQINQTVAKPGAIMHPKLCDASAPLKERDRCTIVFTEGDSAANFMASGLKGIRDSEHKYWGYFPLRGKILNVRNATMKQLASNEEIKMIIKILGLKENTDYPETGTTGLRYGRIMILADADDDGHHIKGLLMNFISYYWPSLAKRPGFICDMATPICKAIKTDKKDKIIDAVEFYSQEESHKWAETGHPGWKLKYYKGLGTYRPEEAKEFCEKMRVTNYRITAECPAKFELAFAKNFEDARKEWLNIPPAVAEEKAANVTVGESTYKDFIDNKLKLFSMADNIRSIPSVMDGLKPGQRKVLYAAFKRRLKQEIKVAQFAGYISEHTAYHHGEISLYDTIIGMARDYVGVNNINLFKPIGQFGSRLGGGPKLKKGENSAAARYVSTNLSYLARLLFSEDDEGLLAYKTEDGLKIEPEWYVPLIPMILVNGAIGIGTGYSTSIPCYNPLDVIHNVRAELTGEAHKNMIPWHRGYNGKIVELAPNRFITVGDWIKLDDSTIRIRELPVGSKNCLSFTAYKEFLSQIVEAAAAEQKEMKRAAKKAAEAGEADLESLPDNEESVNALSRIVQSFSIIKETDTDFVVDIRFKPGVLEDELKNNKDYRFEKMLKLAFIFMASNMHAYDETGIIRRYDSPTEIIRTFVRVREEYYERRRASQLKDYTIKLGQASARYRFVTEIIDGKLDIYRKSKAVITAMLEAADYPKNSSFGGGSEDEDASESREYAYLLSMQVSSFTEETLEELRKKQEDLRDKIANLESSTGKDIWLAELAVFEREYTDDLTAWVNDNTLTVYTDEELPKSAAKPGRRGLKKRV
jgi:DNA topoisomerase-2